MLTIKLTGVKEAMETVDPKIVKQSARAAIDRAVKSGKTVASAEIRAVWNVKKADLDPRIRITPPRMSDLKGVITIGGKGMSLSYFGAKQIMGGTVRSKIGKNIRTSKITRGMMKAGPLPSGVMVEVLKGKNTTLLRNAFLSKVSAGKSGSHIGVYHRLTDKRLPIHEKNVISVATMASRPEVMDKITSRISQQWATEFPRQLQYFLSKVSK